MTARTVLQWPNPFLLKKSSPVVDFGAGLEDLAEDLYHTMVASFGAGLAAPQVGIDKKVCVISSAYVPSLEVEQFRGVDDCVILVNPEIFPASEECFTWEEACLSVPEIKAKVSRFKKIFLTYQNLKGETVKKELEDFQSATVQHEVDHLIGKLFIHRLTGFSRQTAIKKLRKQIVASSKKKQSEEPQKRSRISAERKNKIRKKRKASKKARKKSKR